MEPRHENRGGGPIEIPDTVIDLYAGVGGLSLGAARAGFRLVSVVEKDPQALETHRKNFPATIHLDLEIDRTFAGEELLRSSGLEEGGLGGLIGGPPCQGFSQIGHRNTADARNDQFVNFFRLVAETRPSFYLAENVPGILDSDYDDIRRRALAELRNDYVRLEPFLVNASEYGAPTTRTRVFFVGYRANVFPPLSHADFAAPTNIEKVDVKRALQGLPVYIDPTWQSEEEGWHPVKRCYGMPEYYAERLRGHVPVGVGDPETRQRLAGENLVSGCLGTAHTEKVAARYAALMPGRRDRISKATRLTQEGFCPTLRAGTGSDKGSFQAVRPIHPTEPRVITPREAARLQGFPDWFVFHPTKWHSFRQIGNSVSPLLAERLLRVIRQ